MSQRFRCCPALPRCRISGFTMVELLVVISIIALLFSMLLPALSKARRQANVTICSSQLRQLALGALIYTQDDSEGKFMTHAGGAFPHYYANRMADPFNFRDNYVSGNSFVFHCPVAAEYYISPTWRQATVTNTFAHGQFGYLYLAGWGSDRYITRTAGWTYWGWYGSANASVNGKRIMPTYSVPEAEKLGNASLHPLFMDITKCNNTTNMTGNSLRNYPNPAHGPFRGGAMDPGTDQNIVFVDGHVEHHKDPYRTRPKRGSFGLHF